MANPEHLAMLKRGTKEWNQWRAENLLIRPDFHSAILVGLLHEGMNLSGARLTWTNALDTGLRNIDFSGADLNSANLSWSPICGSSFRNAQLSGTNFNGSDLTGCDLTSAQLGYTVFANCLLREVTGLSTCIHHSPSAIDVNTYLRSGPLPLHFLRGCGVPEAFITYLPSLLSGPVQFYSCFISYSGLDQAFAEPLYADLQAHGVRCWFAPHDIKGGRKLYEQIDEAIRLYDRLLLVLSEHSMNSEWVKTEIANARQRELQEKRRILFPISLVPFEHIKNWKVFDADTGKDSAREVREYFIPNFSNWKDHDSYQTAFERLLRDLKAEGSKNGS